MYPANPYAPPKTVTSDLPVAPGSPFRAVMLGLTVDIGGTVLLTNLAVYGYLGLEYLRSGNLDRAIGTLNALPDYSWLWAVSVLAGLACSTGGGYAAARILQRRSFRLAGLQGAASVILSLLIWPPDEGSHAFDIAISSMECMLTLSAVLGGSWLGSRRGKSG